MDEVQLVRFALVEATLNESIIFHKRISLMTVQFKIRKTCHDSLHSLRDLLKIRCNANGHGSKSVTLQRVKNIIIIKLRY